MVEKLFLPMSNHEKFDPMDQAGGSEEEEGISAFLGETVLGPNPQRNAPITLSPMAMGVPMPLGLAPGRVLQGKYRYELTRRLGAGGFGSVFAAKTLGRDPSDTDAPPEVVAIKVMHTPRKSEASRLLKRELSSLLALRHPRIPRVYDWQLAGNATFVVLTYYPNGSLFEARSLLGTVTADMAWRLLTDLLTAVMAAHRASIHHLDIKPGNVLIDDDGGFVLTDFGIAQGSMVSWNMVTPGLGTRGFQAPEQRNLEEKAIDQRTDLWGIGATVWSIFTGLNLTKSRDIIAQVPVGSPYGLPHISHYRPDTPPDLAEAIMSLLMANPEKRPGGAAEMLARIKAMKSGGGFSSGDSFASLNMELTEVERQRVLESLMEDLWISMVKNPDFIRYMVRFDDGQVLCEEGEPSYVAWLLLKGCVQIERDGKVVDEEWREGTFLGEISTLTGRPRTATMRAKGTCYAAVFNGAELEKAVTLNPAVGIRLIKSMAERVANIHQGNREEQVS